LLVLGLTPGPNTQSPTPHTSYEPIIITKARAALETVADSDTRAVLTHLLSVYGLQRLCDRYTHSAVQYCVIQDGTVLQHCSIVQGTVQDSVGHESTVMCKMYCRAVSAAGASTMQWALCGGVGVDMSDMLCIQV
jgi:hypothetical protein